MIFNKNIFMKKNKITIAYPHYNSIDSLKKQIEVWNSYPNRLKKYINIVIVDDCSKEDISQYLRGLSINVALYQIDEDLVWNDGGAANLSMHAAQTEWVLRTDIDYVVPVETIEYLVNTTFTPKRYFTFNAKYYHNKEIIDIHPSTIFIRKKVFFDAGGYDEDFTGNYGYTDICFIKRLNRISKEKHLDNVYIEALLGGSTHSLIRDNKKNYQLLLKKINEGLPIPTSHFRYKWHKVEL